MRQVELSVHGMTCTNCAAQIERSLTALDGVSEARVDYVNGWADVRCEEELSEEALAAAVDALGYTATLGNENRSELQSASKLLWPVVFGTVVTVLSLAEPLRFAGWDWFSAVLSAAVVFGAGREFFKRAWASLLHRTATMATLVSLSTFSAWLWSAVVLIGGTGDRHLYFETSVVVMVLVLLGRHLETRAMRRAGDAVQALAGMSAPTACLLDGTVVRSAELQVGMRFVVRPGERIAADGVVVDGVSAVDISMVTGEPVPVSVGPGDTVMGAAVNANGSLVVEATRVGADTALAQIVRLVQQAQSRRTRVQRLADRVAAVFVPAAVLVSVCALVVWLATGHAAEDAFTAAVAVLIVSCPCALGLATPLAITVGAGRGAEMGVIIKGADVLEDTRRVDTVAFDKTGTLTEARMEVVEVAAPGGDPDLLLRLAASVEARSEHPVGQAIAAAVPQPDPVSDFLSHPGSGAQGNVLGSQVHVGRSELFRQVPQAVQAEAMRLTGTGAGVVMVGRDGTAEAVIGVDDRLRDTSSLAVAAVSAMGLRTVLLTGDDPVRAQAVGESLGVDEVVAGLTPQGKVEEIGRLQANGRRVAMVGDGVNDAPALALADLGIAMGSGTDVAMESSDLTVVSGDLRSVADAISLSRRTLNTIRSNLFWAFAYNTVAIPLAAFGILDPTVAAVAMASESLFVVGNSLRLRRFQSLRQA